ncbi:MAG: hypothetical protein K2Y28_06180 [Burkholderiaceae bacterium]|nr:hypothetical protein [Burkholderiaceae bacterium]
MRKPENKKPKSHEEKVLRSISKQPYSISELEAHQELMSTTSEDFDQMFMQAIRQRKNELIQKGYGEIQHPTKRLFEIGIDSIKQGKPSKSFLRLLEAIGNKAEERDAMTLLFPEGFPRAIKKTTVRAAQRDAIIVDNFKAHIRTYLAQPRGTVVNGKLGIDAEWGWKDPTYAEAIASYKAVMSSDQKKALDRALQNMGRDLLECRDWITSDKVTSKVKDEI